MDKKMNLAYLSIMAKLMDEEETQTNEIMKHYDNLYGMKKLISFKDSAIDLRDIIKYILISYSLKQDDIVYFFDDKNGSGYNFFGNYINESFSILHSQSLTYLKDIKLQSKVILAKDIESQETELSEKLKKELICQSKFLNYLEENKAKKYYGLKLRFESHISKILTFYKIQIDKNVEMERIIMIPAINSITATQYLGGGKMRKKGLSFVQTRVRFYTVNMMATLIFPKRERIFS